MRIGTRSAALFLLLGASGVSTIVGVRVLLAFDHAPGAVRAVPTRWPSGSVINPPAARPQLVVFVHPFCSCTVASINELARLLARQTPEHPAPAIEFFFYRPRKSEWGANTLWEKTEQLPGAHARWDDDGSEARRFGARTSGYALLYSPRGELLFQGGLTGARGHEGDNYGIERLAASLGSGQPASKPTPVFGCALGSFDE